jgi:hypothetical protein
MTTPNWIDLIFGPDLSAGPYPTVVGLAVRTALVAGLLRLTIGRPATREVAR